MPVVLMLFFFLFLTLFVLLGSVHYQAGAVAVFVIATIIASAGLLKAARMLDRE